MPSGKIPVPNNSINQATRNGLYHLRFCEIANALNGWILFLKFIIYRWKMQFSGGKSNGDGAWANCNVINVCSTEDNIADKKEIFHEFIRIMCEQFMHIFCRKCWRKKLFPSPFYRGSIKLDGIKYGIKADNLLANINNIDTMYHHLSCPDAIYT